MNQTKDTALARNKDQNNAKTQERKASEQDGQKVKKHGAEQHKRADNSVKPRAAS